MYIQLKDAFTYVCIPQGILEFFWQQQLLFLSKQKNCVVSIITVSPLDWTQQKFRWKGVMYLSPKEI